MFSFHKPKIYRSLTGCCICRAKSSSSRFTDSNKYESHFGPCFHLKEERSGDICNACVLLVKRFRKLPSGLQRHWGHVVDARANTKVRTKAIIHEKEEVDVTVVDDADDATDDDDDKLVVKSVRKKRNRDARWNQNGRKTNSRLEDQMPTFLDPSLWHKETVCCGVIFRGPMNAIVIDVNLFQPCVSRRNYKPTQAVAATSPTLSDDCSTSSSQLHFKMESMNSVVEPETSYRPYENQGRSQMPNAVPAAL